MTQQHRLAPGEFRARVVTLDGSTHVLVRGELDLHTGASLWASCQGPVEALPPGAVLVIDLSALEFIDAAGLGVLVRLGNRLGSTGKSLQVKAGCPSIRRVFELAELAGLLTRAPTSAQDPAGTSG